MPSLKPRPHSCQRPRRAAGFTLIEILVALVILSIGLLGVAGLQLRSLQTSHSSFERSIATLQARDLVERMWAGLCDLPSPGATTGPNIDDPTHPIRRMEAAWRADHIATGTFDGQGWAGILEPPVPPNNAWTITISWTGRFQGQTEQIVHHFMLPPPFRPASCPREDS